MNEIMWTWGKLSALEFEKRPFAATGAWHLVFSCVPHDIHDDNDAFTKTENYNNNNNNNNKR